MLEHVASERKVRLLMVKNQELERHVNITLLKRPRENEPDDDSDDDDDSLGSDESIDAYKDWLEEKRDDTIKTYTEWLREQGHLKQIMAYKGKDQPTTVPDRSNGSSTSPETQWPPHARKTNKTKDGKKVGHGSLKGIAAMEKRLKCRTQKYKIDFFENLGGPCGENRRTFVDEVFMFTRMRTPLIGVTRWKDVKEDNVWEIENTDESKKKIWKTTEERYKGWRPTLSATYKAYNSYDERMKHKPEDLDIVE
uniref:Uncharacterized protein n=1 Tax=Setaria viridis TaxID=4556 RepID=A0A4U6UW26_SETVI|nr:hypothetical protein SEVIR_4G116800v2 [Setaria viridis]